MDCAGKLCSELHGCRNFLLLDMLGAATAVVDLYVLSIFDWLICLVRDFNASFFSEVVDAVVVASF